MIIVQLVMFVIIVQLVMEGDAAIEPVMSFGAVLPLLLPKEILAEHWMGPAATGILIEGDGGILLRSLQQFPGAAVGGEDTGKLHVEGGQVQQKTAVYRLSLSKKSA